MLSELQVWHDAEERDGPANMAMDEWLWRHATVPLLRVYHWSGEWMSIGYFSAAAAVPQDRDFVRRPTGGGLVDHRKDWTYTLIVPRGHAVAELPGAESYRMVHQALCTTLKDEGMSCRLKADDRAEHSDFCFRQAVRHDLVDDHGQKLAGAGQRRGKQGLLHQGSVQVVDQKSSQRGVALAAYLAHSVEEISIIPNVSEVNRLSEGNYRQTSWNFRR